ncbi:MAG: AEC family transporter [Acidaminococcaceae bacterium]|nr:AEC family transporter [Acidaminococcaceae bacterium]
MEFVLKALEGIFSIVFIIGIGFVLSRRGWFDEYSSALIARLVTAVSLPLYMIVSISKNFDHNKLVAMAPDLLLPICSMLLAFIVGKLAARIFKIKKERRGIFCTNFFIANTMFIGLPVNLALFGEKSIPAVMLYYMVNTTFFWTLGVHNIVQDTLAHTKNKLAFFLRQR